MTESMGDYQKLFLSLENAFKLYVHVFGRQGVLDTPLPTVNTRSTVCLKGGNFYAFVPAVNHLI